MLSNRSVLTVSVAEGDLGDRHTECPANERAPFSKKTYIETSCRNMNVWLAILLFMAVIFIGPISVYANDSVLPGIFALGAITGGYDGYLVMRIEDLYCMTIDSDPQREEGRKYYIAAKKAQGLWIASILTYLQKKWWQRVPPDYENLTYQADQAFDNLELLINNRYNLNLGKGPVTSLAFPRLRFSKAGEDLRGYYRESDKTAKLHIIAELNKRDYWTDVATIMPPDYNRCKGLPLPLP